MKNAAAAANTTAHSLPFFPPKQKQRQIQQKTVEQPLGKMPGYTGYVLGKQHIFGRTYGMTTRLSQSLNNATNYRKAVELPLAPLGPQNEVPSLDLAGIHNRGSESRVPYVPGYSARTHDEKMETHTKTRGLTIPGKPQSSRIYTARISSDPLAGQLRYEKPQMLIPSNLSGLKYTS